VINRDNFLFGRFNAIQFWEPDRSAKRPRQGAVSGVFGRLVDFSYGPRTDGGKTDFKVDQSIIIDLTPR
jgi:hypothetical protein